MPETGTTMQSTSARAYLENKIMTATTEQLQLMLYEGAIRFATVSRSAMAERDYERSLVAYERCNEILCELHSGLRPDQDSDLANKMGTLYGFCQRKLNEGQFKHDVRLFDEALDVLKHIRETWLLVMEQIREHRTARPAMTKVEEYVPLAVDA